MYFSSSFTLFFLSSYVGWDSSVGIATRYGLDCPAIESRWGGKIFRTLPDRPLGPPILLYNRYRCIPRGKLAGAWRWPPTPSDAKVKERVDLYFYSPSGPLLPVLGWTLPFFNNHVQFYQFLYLCKARNVFLKVIWTTVIFFSLILMCIGLMMARK